MLGAGTILFLLPLMSFNVQSHLIGKPLNFEKVSILVLGLGWLAHRYRTRNAQLHLPLYLSIMWAAYLLTFMAAGINHVISGGSIFSQVWFFAERLSHFVIFLVAWDLLSHPEAPSQTMKILIASLFVVLTMGVLEWSSHYLSMGKIRFYFSDVVEVTYDAAVASFQHPSMMAAYIVLISPLVYTDWKYIHNKIWLRHIATVSALVLVILSFSQSALIGLLIAGLIVCGRLNRPISTSTLLLATSVLAASLIWTGISDLKVGINVRLYTWGVAATSISEKPLAGHGLGQSADAF